MATGKNSKSRLSLRRMMGWSVVGQLIYTIGQFALLTVLARFASVEDVGRFGLATAIIVPLWFFFRLNMRANQATDLGTEYRFSEFLKVQTISISICFLIIFCIAAFMNDPVARSILLIYGAAKCVEAFSDLFYGRFQRSERMGLVGLSLFLRGTLSTILFSVVLIKTGNISLSFVAHLTVWGAVALLFDFPNAKRLASNDGDTGSCRPGKSYGLARGALPLGINGLFSGLQGQAPRFAVGAALGVTALGQFTVAAYAIQAVTTFFMALGQALMTRLAQFVQQGTAQPFRRAVHRMLLFCGVGGTASVLAALVFGNWIMATVFGPSYEGLGLLLTFCMAAATAQAFVIIIQSALFSLRKFRETAYLRSAMLTILLLAVAVGVQFGLIGVTISLSLVSALHAALMYTLLRRFLSKISRNAN